MINLIGISGKIESGKDTVGKIIQSVTNGDHLQGTIDVVKNNYACPETTWQVKKFAGKLKQIVSILTGIPVDDLEKQEVKDRVLGEEWNRYSYAIGHTTDNNGNKTMLSKQCDKDVYEYEKAVNWQTAYKYEFTVRKLLQAVGTEAMRDVIHQNVWVNALFADYKAKTENPELSVPKEVTNWGNYPNWIITDVRFPNEAKAIKDRGGIVIRVNRYTAAEAGAKVHLDLQGIKEHPSETALDDYQFDHYIKNDGTIEELVERTKHFLDYFKIK